jgi:hypothetical protein
MQSIDLTDLNSFDEDLKALLEEVPERRRELHERIADAMKEEVDFQIANSGLNDNSGRIKNWQSWHVGSRGGYAAVRASDKSIGDNSPGAITNYLENGHKIREPSENSKKYRPRIKTPYISGYHFYQSARNNVEWRAIAEAEEYVKEIAQRLEG